MNIEMQSSSGTPSSGTARGIRPRHFFFLIDGTWVSASVKPGENEKQSNIFELNRLIDKQNAIDESQITFYIPGVGSASRGNWLGEKLIGGGFAHGLDTMVEQAYVDLVSNFRSEGNVIDKIYIFGFSRGAVVARVLADIISTFGVLEQDHIHMYQELWDHCSGEKRKNHEAVGAIRSNYCIYPVDIEFLGVFDTVPGITGILEGKTKNNIRNILFEDRKVSEKVKDTVQILSMNESRVEFMPVPFSGVSDPARQSLQQIWMPGCHSDIGGAYGNIDDPNANSEISFLGNVSLLTMASILQEKVPRIGFEPRKLGVVIDNVKRIKTSKNFIMNTELGGYWIISSAYASTTCEKILATRPLRGWKWIHSWQRQSCCENIASQFYHPICDDLNNEDVLIKGAKRKFLMQDFYNKGWAKLNLARLNLYNQLLATPVWAPAPAHTPAVSPTS